MAEQTTCPKECGGRVKRWVTAKKLYLYSECLTCGEKWNENTYQRKQEAKKG
jgi:hypothetical protein